jgi:hypothetical protein
MTAVPRLLVLGGRTTIALHICRALHRAGCVVVAADSLASSITRFSRAAAHFERLPRPGADPFAFIDAVAAVARRHGIDRVVPTGEERMWLALAEADGCALPTPVAFAQPLSLLAALHDKLAFQGLLHEAGVEPTPTVVATAAGIASLRERFGRVLVKPRVERFGRGVVIVEASQPPSSWPVDEAAVAQPFVAGEERCGFVIADHGRVVVAVVYVPRWRFLMGPSFGMVPVEDSAIVTAMTRVVAHHRLDGAFGVDVIVRPDGTLAFLECNPRFTSGLHFVDDATIVETIVPGRAAASRPLRASRPRMVAPAMLWCGARRLGSSRVGSWWHDYWASDDVIWDRHDPWPALACFGNAVELLALARSEGIPVRFATSHQLGWDPSGWLPVEPAEDLGTSPRCPS